MPTQTIVYSRKGHNNTTKLPFHTSLYDLKHSRVLPRNQIIVRDGLRLFSTDAALMRVPESFFRRNQIEVQMVLSSITDVSNLLRMLLDGGHSAIAGRLAGALRRVNGGEQANEILSTMKAAGYDVRESDPFESEQNVFAISAAEETPIVGRLKAMWAASRETVLKCFPSAPGLPRSKKAYLSEVDEVYKNDAYHSLSLEGFRVSPELIERVMSGKWDPRHHEADRQNRDALAAGGYWQAFQRVKVSVSKALAGENARRDR